MIIFVDSKHLDFNKKYKEKKIKMPYIFYILKCIIFFLLFNSLFKI
jgi:hypothetical protein